MKPLPQTQAKATHAAMTITNAQRSEGNRGPGCRSSRVPARERSSRVPADPTVRRSKEGRVDPNREVRGKATEARSRLFDDADRTGQDSQEIVQYQRADLFVPSFFFSFFLNHVIIDLGTKSCMQLALWHIKNLNSKN